MASRPRSPRFSSRPSRRRFGRAATRRLGTRQSIDQRTGKRSLEIPVPAVDALLKKLMRELRRAYRSPDKKGLPPSVMLQERHINALMSVVSFVKECGVGRDVVERIAGLAQALFDLRTGARSPLFEVIPHRGRTPDRSDVWSIRAYAMIGLECLIGRDDDPRKAAQRAAALVAEQYPGLSALRRTDKDDLAKSLLSWRAAFRSNKVTNVAAQRAYNDMAKMLMHADASMRASSAERLLSSAEARAKALAK